MFNFVYTGFLGDGGDFISIPNDKYNVWLSAALLVYTCLSNTTKLQGKSMSDDSHSAMTSTTHDKLETVRLYVDDKIKRIKCDVDDVRLW